MMDVICSQVDAAMARSDVRKFLDQEKVEKENLQYQDGV
jgi:hypothetical protein